MLFRKLEITPADLYLGALNLLAVPYLDNDRSEELSELAQFYGYEDFGESSKNTQPRITEVEIFRPSPDNPAVVVTVLTPQFMLPGALTRATGRWAKMKKMTRTGAHEWRGAGLTLKLETKRRGGKTSARAVLTRET